MITKIKKITDKYGYIELFMILLYPIVLPIFMIRDTSISIINIVKALLKYDWKFLSGNDQKNAYNNLFYYIQDYNIQRFGRYGTSDSLAGGKLSLRNWFHTTPFSLRSQSKLGTTFILFFAMCFWFISWVVLYKGNPELPIILVCVFFSTLFFAVFIEAQNYNILGWMLYPIFLFYIINGNYFLLGLVLFFISLSSFTAFFISGILIVGSSIILHDYILLISLIPAGIKWLIPILFAVKDGSISNILGALGGHEKVKYSRQNSKKLNFRRIHTLGLLIQFLIFSYLFGEIGYLYVLLVSIVGLFVINELFVRFADQQSFYIAYLSLSVSYLLNIDTNITLVISFIISIFPIYGFMMNVMPRGKSFISPAIRTPYNIRSTIDRLMNLLEIIPEGSILLMAYKNPQGKYENIFNRYRAFNEPLQYSGTMKNIKLFPDWYYVFNNNKENCSELFWVNNGREAKSFMESNNIKYVLVPDFNHNGWEEFELLGSFSFQLDKSNTFNIDEYTVFLYKI